MRCFVVRPLSLFAALLLLSMPLLAEKYRASDYPLRVHIVNRNGIRHYSRIGGTASSLDEVDGLGQANLFENGEPRGFDFNHACGQPITPQMGYETFLARWKRQDRELEILMPVIGGKPGDMNVCNLKVSMKPDEAYVRHNGEIGLEPSATFKDWMAKHEYDPEHGKDLPVNLPAHKAAGGDEQQ